jgi:ABC-type transport system involved in Fe-S cluster assembly fused permease/ATPase subunit
MYHILYIYMIIYTYIRYMYMEVCHRFKRRMHPADPAMDLAQSDSILNCKIIVT